MKCRTNGCKNQAAKREVCVNCYQTCHRAVKAGKTTWQQLEENGFVGKRGARQNKMTKLLKKSGLIEV